ncbi:MAG: hypothetical protein ACRD2W_19695 [Acidimicrobiales bacterium]
MSDAPNSALAGDKPSLRYLVTAICTFDFVTSATPHQEKDIPALLEQAIRDAVDNYSTRNTQATNVELVSVNEF